MEWIEMVMPVIDRAGAVVCNRLDKIEGLIRELARKKRKKHEKG